MNTDFNQYKGLIAEKVKEATGRNLSIAGDIETELPFTPSLSVSGVRFENAEWLKARYTFCRKIVAGRAAAVTVDYHQSGSCPVARGGDFNRARSRRPREPRI